MELISQQVLSSPAATVTFSSIPQTFRDLVITNDVPQTTTFNNILTRFNGDTGSNYLVVNMVAGTSAFSQTGSGSSANFGFTSDSARTNAMVTIFDYTQTNKHKSSIGRFNAATTRADLDVERWANTAAITSIEIRWLSGDLPTGSTFTLYGISA